MKKFLSNYKSTIILLAAIIVGAIAGIIFKEKAAIVSPLGDVFLNLMFVSIVPLIFLTISTSISKMKQPKRLGKIMGTIVIVFIMTSLVAVIIGLLSTYWIKLVNTNDSEMIKEALVNNEDSLNENDSSETKNITILGRTVQALTVNDFSKLLSKENLIALIVFSIMFGIAMNMSGKKSEPLEKVLLSANDVVMNFIKIIMYYAPIGLGCYIAALVGTFGATIAVGYAKTFIIYSIVAVAFYGIIYSLYSFIAGGKKGLISFWKNILPATATSLATCSSAASIPVNIECSRNIGVSSDIAETIIPMGTSFHKDGSIIGSVFKIMFLVALFSTNVFTFGGIMKVLGVALVANLLVTAVPIGGGTISEMMIIAMMGYPVYALPILTIIATIIDPPATLLNVVGDTSSSMIAARIIDGKDWNKKVEE